MKKTTKELKLIAGIAFFCFGLMSANSAMAWGPERTKFTMEEPATYPVFNSITNNPTIGDERDFVRVGEINADTTKLGNEVEVVPGRQYLVYIYFHNDASSTYNDAEHNNAGVAFQTRLASSFSTVLTPNEKGTITATISAENSNPLSVWDEAYMTTKASKVLLHYVEGSAKIYNNYKANGSVMPSNLFSKEGTYVGLNSLNGVILGCEEYHGIVTYVVQAEELKGTIEKTVSTDGKTYKKNASFKAGDTIYYKLTIKNAGDVALSNAIVKDTLPTGIKLVPGSVKLTANDSSTSESLSDNLVNNGYNLGTIGTGNTVTITYQATSDGDFDCKGKTLENKASLTYDSDVKSGDTSTSSAKVTIKKANCDEDKPPVPEDPEEPETPDEPETPEEPDEPEKPEDDCKTNPEMEGCQQLPVTGPLEIVMAIIIIGGIGGAGYYLYRTKRTLKTVEDITIGKPGEEK